MVEIPKVVIPPLDPTSRVDGGYLPYRTTVRGGTGIAVSGAGNVSTVSLDLDDLGPGVGGGSYVALEGGVPVLVPFSTALAVAHTHPQSEIDNLVTDLALKAPLASPAFTGSPTAPTATVGTNTTQIATTAFVLANAGVFTGDAGDIPFTPNGTLASTNVEGALYELESEKASVAALDLKVDTTGDTMTGQLVLPIATTGTVAPLNIPTAITGTVPTSVANGDIWTTAAGLNARIGGVTQVLAPLANPTFTGSPAAPTALTSADNTQIATTAFVKAVAASYAPLAAPTFTGEVTLTRSRRTRQSVVSNPTTNIDRANGELVELQMTGNITTLNITNWPANGYTGQTHLKIDFTGAFTIAWPAAVRWPGAVAPTLTGVNGRTDHVMLQTEDGGTTVYGFVMGQNYVT
jgi:hypothetical protein